MDMGTNIKVLSIKKLVPPDLAHKKLKLAKDEKVLTIDKIKLVQDTPLFHIINYLPGEVGNTIDLCMLDEQQLLMILEGTFGMKASEAVQLLDVAPADVETAEILNLRVDNPLLTVEQTVFDAGGQPMEHVSVWCPANRYSFIIKHKRYKSENADGWGAKFQPRMIS